MAIGEGIKVEKTFSPDAIWFAKPSTLHIGTFAVQKELSFDVTWKEKTYQINGLTKIEIFEDRLIQSPLLIGTEFRVQSDNRIFKVLPNGIEIIGGQALIIAEPIVAVSAAIPTSIADGKAYILNNNNTLFPGKVMIGRPLAGQILWEPLQYGSVFMLDRRLTWERFDGNRTYPISYPIGVAFAVVKNISLTSLTVKECQSASDTYRGSLTQLLPTANYNVILLGQDDKKTNGIWQLRFIDGNLTETIRLPPYVEGLGYREGETSVEVWRGDIYGGKYLTPINANPQGAGTQVITIGTTPHNWEPLDKDYIEINRLKNRIDIIESSIENIEETDPVALEALATLEATVTDLSTTIDGLASSELLDPIKADIKTLTTNYNNLSLNKADKTAVDAANAAIKAVSDAVKALPASPTKAEFDALAVKVEAAETSITAVQKSASDNATEISKIKTQVTDNYTALNTAIAGSIADWKSDRQYKVGNKAMVNKTFFIALQDSTGKDPTKDTSGAWGLFTPGTENDVFANRSPVATDVFAAGVKWWDVSFGADTPLGFISLGNGAWQYLNQISLSRIRFVANGIGSTFKSGINTIQFFKADGTAIPNGWFVWGRSYVLKIPIAGVAYSGQGIGAAHNASGWAELEPSAAYDLSISIGKITASPFSTNWAKVEFYYSNGSVKTYTPASGEVTCTPPLQSRFGDAIAGVLGETLTAAKLGDATNKDPGRLTGEAFVSAWNTLYNAQKPVADGRKPIHSDHFPTDAEITGLWDFWVAKVPQITTILKESFMWVGDKDVISIGSALIPRPLVEENAIYNSDTGLHSIGLMGINFEYAKTPISKIGNTTFDNPSYGFQFPDANTQFTNISYKTFDAGGKELKNGGQVLVSGANLTVIPPVPGTSKIRFEFTPLVGAVAVYEVNL